jgi:hypothetical protein
MQIDENPEEKIGIIIKTYLHNCWNNNIEDIFLFFFNLKRKFN